MSNELEKATTRLKGEFKTGEILVRPYYECKKYEVLYTTFTNIITRDEDGVEQMFSDYKAREIFERGPKEIEIRFWANIYLDKNEVAFVGNHFSTREQAINYIDDRDYVSTEFFIKTIEVDDA